MFIQYFAHGAFGPKLTQSCSKIDTSIERSKLLTYCLWKVSYFPMAIQFGCKESMKNPVILKSGRNKRGQFSLFTVSSCSKRSLFWPFPPCHTPIACLPLQSWLFLPYRSGSWIRMAPAVDANACPEKAYIAYSQGSSPSSSLHLLRACSHSDNCFSEWKAEICSGSDQCHQIVKKKKYCWINKAALFFRAAIICRWTHMLENYIRDQICRKTISSRKITWQESTQ